MPHTDASYFKSIVQTINHPLLVLDSTLKVKTANNSFYKTFKVTPEATIEKYIYQLGNGQWNTPFLRTLFDEILPKNTSINNLEIELDFPTIGWRWMLLNAAQIVSPDEPSSLILLSIEDITEKRTAAENLKIFSAKLERSNSELQNFAQVASHDLQEPLRKIQAFGDCLRLEAKDSLNEENRDYLERMLNAASRMQILINDLLDFSRVETKIQPFKAVSIEQICREVVNDLESKIKQVKGTIEIGELPVIEADSLQMRQLLQNLIGNSLKYHREQIPPVVRIHGETINQSAGSIQEELQTNKYCRILVEDNGIGFDEKYLDRIFNVFQRLHGRGEFEGTGIGLAVCRKIVERHGGSITARSEPGKGAKFIVTLPITQNKNQEVELLTQYEKRI